MDTENKIKLLRDIVRRVLNNELRIGVLENIIDLLLTKNPTLVKFTKEELDTITEKVVERLQSKYPNNKILK